MVETATVRVYQSDKERIKEMADARGSRPADVVADLLREPAYVCPECDDPFDPEEVDPESVEEHGMLTTTVDNLVKGQRDVKSFECPSCSERVRPKDIRAVDDDSRSGVTRGDVGITEENEEQEFSTEEV